MRLIALLSVFAMAGCATITTAHNYHGVNVEGGEVPIESVVIENTGWKIFDLIPIKLIYRYLISSFPSILSKV